jgi:hypothetical protein
MQKSARSSKQQYDLLSTTSMMYGVLQQANLSWADLDGLVAVPSLTGNHFMEAHDQATTLGLFGATCKDHLLQCRTINTGRAGPISALLESE